MIIRKARPEDKPQMVDILNAVIALGGTTAYEDPLTTAHFDPLIDNTDPRIFLHVAETANTLQGLQWIEPLDPPHTHIGGIATFARPKTTQNGIGTALFQTTKQASKTAGYTELYAKIRADNSGGLVYYEKMGFRDHHIDRAIPLKDGTPVDRITKRLKLAASH